MSALAKVLTLVVLLAAGEPVARTFWRMASDELARGQVDAAASFANDAAAADSRLAPWRDFLLGNVAFARCEQADQLAATREGGLPALEEALAHARAARDSWQLAAASRDDWPAARRNVERALLKLAGLERKKSALLRKNPPPPPQQPLRPPPTDDPNRPPPKPVQPAPQLTELTPEQIDGLFERLARKEREKLAVRRERRSAASAGVEQDW